MPQVVMEVSIHCFSVYMVQAMQIVQWEIGRGGLNSINCPIKGSIKINTKQSLNLKTTMEDFNANCSHNTAIVDHRMQKLLVLLL